MAQILLYCKTHSATLLLDKSELDPVPWGGKMPIVLQSAGVLAKVVAQLRRANPQMLMHRTGLKMQLEAYTRKLRIRFGERVRVMGNLLDRTAASGLEKRNMRL